MIEISSIGVLTAFAAGIVSFLSPCVLPLVPGYLSYVAGQSVDDARWQQDTRERLATLRLTVFFVLGFSTVFIILGASATALGQLLMSYRYEANIVGGAIVILFGLFMTGVLKLSWLQRDLRFHADVKGGRPIAAYVLGLSFAFGWAPCIGPVLGAILTVSAVSVTASDGIALMTIYSLGLGLPFMVSGVFTGGLLTRLTGMRRAGRLLQVGAGGVMMLMGTAMITGDLTALSYWLLEAFPGLANIG